MHIELSHDELYKIRAALETYFDEYGYLPDTSPNYLPILRKIEDALEVPQDQRRYGTIVQTWAD